MGCLLHYEAFSGCRWCCCVTIITIILMWMPAKLFWVCFMIIYPYSLNAGPPSTRKGICSVVKAACHIHGSWIKLFTSIGDFGWCSLDIVPCPQMTIITVLVSERNVSMCYACVCVRKVSGFYSSFSHFVFQKYLLHVYYVIGTMFWCHCWALCKQIHFLFCFCKLYFPGFLAKWLLTRFSKNLEVGSRAGRRGEAMVFLTMSPVSRFGKRLHLPCVPPPARQLLSCIWLLRGSSDLGFM